MTPIERVEIKRRARSCATRSALGEARTRESRNTLHHPVHGCFLQRQRSLLIADLADVRSWVSP